MSEARIGVTTAELLGIRELAVVALVRAEQCAGAPLIQTDKADWNAQVNPREQSRFERRSLQAVTRQRGCADKGGRTPCHYAARASITTVNACSAGHSGGHSTGHN